MFNVVKLSAALDDPIPGRELQALPPPIVVNREPEWEVKEVLDSCWHQRRFQFLIKWKGFSREHNSWEVASDVKAPDLIAEYYRRHPAAPRHICQMDFDTLFKSGTIALRRSNLGGEVNVRGPLIHDSGVTLQPIQYYYVILGLTPIIPRALHCHPMHFPCSDPSYRCRDTKTL